MKRTIKYPKSKITASTESRDDLERKLNLLKDEFNDVADFEDIMLQHGANEDDSDPDEGYFNTMSDDDLKEAYDEVVSILVSEQLFDLTDDLMNNLKDTYNDISSFMTHSRKTFESMPEHVRDQFDSILSGIQHLSEVIRGE